MLMSFSENFNSYFHSVKDKIRKVRFAVNVKVPKNKIYSWDVSEARDKSVMAWVEDDGNNGYELTIAGKEKIIANPDSSRLFYKFKLLKEIENIELLDTSRVNSMKEMFWQCNSLTSLNLSSFNTSNVTDMGEMFRNCRKLESLNLGNNFNTNKVKKNALYVL